MNIQSLVEIVERSLSRSNLHGHQRSEFIGRCIKSEFLRVGESFDEDKIKFFKTCVGCQMAQNKKRIQEEKRREELEEQLNALREVKDDESFMQIQEEAHMDICPIDDDD